MLETKVLPITENQEKRLKKNEFNEKFRFREARKEGLVTCASCAHISGGAKRDEVALCQHSDRLRKIKIAEYHEGFWGEKGESDNTSSHQVCDAYINNPLPAGVVVPNVPDKHAILLGTQFRDPYHADPKCPYVVEEARIIRTGEKTEQGRTGDIHLIDLSDMVPGETLRDICDMPCCEKRLPFQISSANNYRRQVGIKPDGTEPRVWVRNGIVKHEKKAAMTLEEAEAFFDLTTVVSEHKDIYHKIVAVSDYLHGGCNWLGSRPLAEATNPVGFSGRHHFWNGPMSSQYPAQFWAYDERLFDRNTELKIPLLGLEKIPEGFILCLDTKGVLRNGMYACRENTPIRFLAHGILRPMEDLNLLSKSVSHFLDIREVHYMSSPHWWGEFGIGFSGLESFDEE